MDRDDERTAEFKFNWVFNDITQKKEKVKKEQSKANVIFFFAIKGILLSTVIAACFIYRSYNDYIITCMTPNV